MDGKYLLIGTCIILAIILITVTLFLIQKMRINRLKKEIEILDREKNIIASSDVVSELSKVEAVVKNEKLEEKYHEWQDRYNQIKTDKINEINDMIIDLDLSSNMKDYKDLNLKLTRTELEVYKARESIDELLDEIKEVTLSEEKYRSIVTKLKSKYREFIKKYKEHKSEYEYMSSIVELQLENIEKRFQDFEKYMENNEYEEVVHIVKALDNMIEHMSIIVEEVPDLILLSNKIIPKKLDEIEDIYQDMLKKGYPLSYLKIEYNTEEIRKHIEDITSRMKVLNLEDCMFELKTILDYIDETFNDFENEKLSRKIYDEEFPIFVKKINKINRIVKDIYMQLEDIMSMYHLKEKDIESLDRIKLRVEKINSEYKDVKVKLESGEVPYSKSVKEVNRLKGQLKNVEDDLDYALKNLGSMYDDELRAHEQLEEIEGLLKDCKVKIKSYKLPVIASNYFVELKEANEAVEEIIKELSKKPIVIKTLNMRVDTARDLVFKVFNTTTEMIKYAKTSENVIVYGNRYRYTYQFIDEAIEEATDLFYKGNYKEAFEVSVNAIMQIDKGVEKFINNG